MPKNLISIQDFSKEEILHILSVAREFEAAREQDFLRGKVVACLFFEPSTRTRLSFEAAVSRLGAQVIGFPDNRNTSQSKGETLEDTIRIISNYVDLIVMRHPMAGAADIAASVAGVPVVNAGDGANQHPTQTLLDLYAIEKTQGTLENLHINMVGDLRYGRTVHSLSQAMHFFHPTFTFTAPEELRMPRKYLDFLDGYGIPHSETERLEDHLNDCDILYMTRVQGERFLDRDSYEKVKDVYTLSADMLGGVKPNPRLSKVHGRQGDIRIKHPAPVGFIVSGIGVHDPADNLSCVARPVDNRQKRVIPAPAGLQLLRADHIVRIILPEICRLDISHQTRVKTDPVQFL